MDMQNVSNLEIPEGEVRTIHDKNSRLLWGRVNYDTKYKGDTAQQTYSGKNLFNVDGDFNYGSTSHSTTKNGDGTITSSSKISSYRSSGQKIEGLLPNTKYTLSATVTAYDGDAGDNSNVGMMWVINGSASVDYVYFAKRQDIPTSGSLTFTTPADTSDIWISFNSVGTNGTPHTTYSNIQLELGQSVTSFEKFVGGAPSPSPDYPQTVSVVTGEQIVTLSDGNISATNKINLGKNLFNVNGDFSYGTGAARTTSNGDGTLTTTARLEWQRSKGQHLIGLSPNSEYTLSANMDSYTGGSTSSTGVIEVLNGNTLINRVSFNGSGPDSKTLSFTTPTSTGDIWVSFSAWNSTAAYPSATFSNIQIEAGPTASTYTPYITPIELCKIGDYQDYIYKSGDDWYVHKATGSETLLSTRDWHVRSDVAYADGWTVFRDYDYVSGVFNSNAPGFSNYFRVLTTNIYEAGGIRLVNSDTWGVTPALLNSTLGITSSDSSDSKATKFKTWLSNHSVSLYYVLATPTDTKITDNTLIGQLNAVHQWLTRYGYNDTVSGNLPIIIDRTNL